MTTIYEKMNRKSWSELVAEWVGKKDPYGRSARLGDLIALVRSARTSFEKEERDAWDRFAVETGDTDEADRLLAERRQRFPGPFHGVTGEELDEAVRKLSEVESGGGSSV
jgi:hypothetical protein